MNARGSPGFAKIVCAKIHDMIDKTITSPVQMCIVRSNDIHKNDIQNAINYMDLDNEFFSVQQKTINFSDERKANIEKKECGKNCIALPFFPSSVLSKRQMLQSLSTSLASFGRYGKRLF